jgi:energy-coupling factor transport system ATP-binding protein
VLADSPVAPPVVELGRLAGWHPLPLSVRDARRRAAPLRSALESAVPPVPQPLAGAPVLTAAGVVVRYGPVIAVREVGVDLAGGEVVALMGRNGSGKSSLLWALQGTGARQSGSVSVGGVDPAQVPPHEARGHVGLVPQTPADLLYLDTVDAECAQADAESEAAAGHCRALLDQLVPTIPGDHHPRDLSEGQRLALVLAIQLAAAPAVLLLDEPTRGLDYPGKARLREMVRALAADGRAVVLATHDVEFAAAAADRVVVMAEGEVIADGRTADVLVASPAFAPQVAKVLAPQAWLTVDQVAHALAVVQA